MYGPLEEFRNLMQFDLCKVDRRGRVHVDMHVCMYIYTLINMHQSNDIVIEICHLVRIRIGVYSTCEGVFGSQVQAGRSSSLARSWCKVGFYFLWFGTSHQEGTTAEWCSN